MEHAFLVVLIVLVSFIALAQPEMRQSYGHKYSHKGHLRGRPHKARHQLCYPTASLEDECDTNKVCAWNMRNCPGYPNCFKICTDNPYKLCYGMDQGDNCNDGDDSNPEKFSECVPDTTGELVCVNMEEACDECGGGGG